MASSTRNIKFILPPTAPLRYKTAAFSTNTKVIDVLHKLTDLCHFVNFAASGYGLYLPKRNGSSRGKWLEDERLLSDYPEIEESIELRKKPGFRSNTTGSTISTGSVALKEGNALRYSPLTRLWSPCVLRLYNNELAILSSEHDNNPNIINLAGVTKVGQATEKKYAFFVAVEDTKSTFRCRNNAESLEWIKFIGQSVTLVNPEFVFNINEFIPVVSPRARGASFLNILTREDSSSVTESSLHGSGGISPRPGSTLSPREERKKYSFLTLRNNKKSKDKEASMFNLRSSKGAEKEKEPREREESHKKLGRRNKSVTVSHSTTSASAPATPFLQTTTSSSTISSSISLSSPSSPTSAPSSPVAPSQPDLLMLDDDDDLGIRARSHSTSTTYIPQIPTIQSLLTAKRISTNEAEIHMLREKLQYQTEQSRQMEQKYQNILLKYTEQANKSSLKNAAGPLVDVSPLATSHSLPSLESDTQQTPPTPLRKSSSMLWRWSKKTEPEVLELKLELQQLKAENRVMKLQLDRRADRDSRSISSSKSGSDRKRTSPRSRRNLRDELEKERSMGRIEHRATKRDSANLSASNSETDLYGLTYQMGRLRSESEARSEGFRSRSVSIQSEEETNDVLLRESIRNDFTVPISPTIRSSASREEISEYARSRSNTVGGSSDVEALQKEMANLRERLLEQQQLFRREENNRLHVEREYRKVTQADENALLDMESITRLLQQTLGKLKESLEEEFGDYSDADVAE